MTNKFSFVVGFYLLLLLGCNNKNSEARKVNDPTDLSNTEAIDSLVSLDTVKSESDILTENMDAHRVKRKKIPEGRCDLAMVLKTQNKIDSLSNLDIFNFLFTFSEDCLNNVEFGEYGNEVLFQVLIRYPELISKNLTKDSIYQKVIIKEISNPVAEMTRLDEIITNIKKLEISNKVKKEIIYSFKTTIGYQ